MVKTLFATINVAKENEKNEVRIYKTKGEKYGIEVVDSNENVKSAENITSSEKMINSLLDTIVLSTQNFTLLEDFASDFSDAKKII